MKDLSPYADRNGNFQLANFIYRTINDMMKYSLDMGTLLSDDTAKLRAYKEQVKKVFKSKWNDIAEVLEYFELIEKCECNNSRHEPYCDICKGARYRVADFVNPDEIREIGTFISLKDNSERKEQIYKTLIQAIPED
jgi:CDGSH-type Zn-finger protein